MQTATAWARRGRTAQILVAVAAAVIGVGAVVGLHALLASGPAPAPAQPTLSRHGLDGQATWAAGAQPAPAITTLRDQSGRSFSLASLRGRTVVMEFFDSHCRQECPLAGRALAAAERLLPRARRPVLVVVSVNPVDTPASARAAVRAWGLSRVAPWHWLMGTHARLAPVWAAYHIFVQPTKGDISHTEALYVIDRHGDERSGYLYPYLPGRVAHDLRVLAAPPPRAGRA
ncbi:MAG TPA: SCO family protein [Solirubrobacteraceae bacterium]|jgi:cytochrome oxidase Cu insertion factor (SCO1/SenC/PrrC family)